MSEKIYQLVMQQGPKPGQAFDLVRGTMVIGRDALADIIIVDPEVSRQHVEIVETDMGHRLKDLGSTNGTFVNGRRVTDKPVDLELGQEIKLGSTIVLHYQEADDSAIVPTTTAVTEDDSPLLLGQTAVFTAPAADAAAEETADDEFEVEWGLPTNLAKAENDEEEDEEIGTDEATADDLDAIFGETADFDSSERETADLPPISSPPPPAPVIPSAQTDFTPPAETTPPPRRNGPLVPPGSGSRKRSNRNRIVLITAVFLLLCCCAFMVYMYFVGGDLLLESLGLL